jgi:hypothetical protein
MSESDRLERHRNRVWTSAAAIVNICSHYATLLMATLPNTTPRASWTEVEVDALVNYMFDHRAEAGDGGNFKVSTYTAAAAHIAQFTTPPQMKSVKSLQGKWQSVRCCHLEIDSINRRVLQLKGLHSKIETYAGKSGVHWDNERGANIEGPAAMQVWNDYVKDTVDSVHFYVQLNPSHH